MILLELFDALVECRIVQRVLQGELRAGYAQNFLCTSKQVHIAGAERLSVCFQKTSAQYFSLVVHSTRQAHPSTHFDDSPSIDLVQNAKNLFG